MDKRLIASIKSNIEKLDKKIIDNKDEISSWELQREKFLEMLELISPKSELPSQPAASHGAQAATEQSETAAPVSPEGKKSAFHEKFHKTAIA